MRVLDYLARQLAGPRITQIANGITDAFTIYLPYYGYLSSISIMTAEEQDLESIGNIIGYIWPLVPNEVILEKLFRFSSYLTAPSFSETGFSGISGTIDGGNFSQVDAVLTSNKMPIAQYRLALIAIAKLKWSKYSIVNIAAVCRVFHTLFDITWDANHELIVTFKTDGTQRISLTNLYLVSRIFDDMMDTTPHVICVRE